MKRPRPYIPLEVRLLVAERQIKFSGKIELLSYTSDTPLKAKLALSLKALAAILGCEFHELHLDHDPALRIRVFNEKTGLYTPDANDPRCLIYRTIEDHRIKTLVRGEKGQFSDVMLMNRERKRERKEAGRQRPKTKWQTGRKIQSRGFDRKPK